MQLVGNKVVCPGEVVLYKCNTIDETGLEWIVDGQGNRFNGFDEVGESFSIGDSSVACLVGREVDGDNLGNRTSILQFTLDTSTTSLINVSCFADRACIKTINYGGNR